MKETPIFEEVFARVLKLPSFWIKVLIGGLLSFVPILNFFAFGYLFRFSRGVRQTGGLAMPEWEAWNMLFMDGLKFAVVWLAYWLLPLLLALAASVLVGFLGLGAFSYLIFSLAFLLSPILFSSALYRYNMRTDLKDLLDVALIVRMTYVEFPRLIIPALAFVGILAVGGALYGFALFFGFLMLIAFTSLTYRSIEQNRSFAL
ncbi:MAG: DUF4013 domain-containing protein [Verrucomicrobiota bacterium]